VTLNGLDTVATPPASNKVLAGVIDVFCIG
jgi:hypothetical protein